MKWRNQLLALFCLIVFFTFGVFYFRYWVIQKPFGIILFVAEDLEAQHLVAARISLGGPEKPLAIDSLPYVALLKNYSADSPTPDAAAAATALATGVKVKNGSLAIDVDGNELQNLLELARNSGRMTGLVTNGSLTRPTAASFFAHTRAVENRAEIAQQLVTKSHLDVVLGGGAAEFARRGTNDESGEEQNLLANLRDAGYEIVQTLSELEDIARWRRAKLFGLFAEAELPFADEIDAADDQPNLADLVRRSIELLQYNRGGYLLIVDVALIRKAAEEGNAERVAAETVELDRAIAVALSYAGAKSAIFLCGDVAERRRSIATLQAKTEPPMPQQIASDSQPLPAPDIVPTPNRGGSTTEEPVSPNLSAPLARPQNEEPAPVTNVVTATTGEDVVAFGSNLGADALHGVAESTVIFDIIRDNL